MLLSYLASSDAVFLTIGRRTRPYWQSYVAWSATIPSGRSTLRKRSRSCQSMSAWKSSVCEPGRSVMVVVMTVSSSAVRTRTRAAPFSVSTDSIDPVMAFAMSRDSRSISQASQTAGSSFNSSYWPNRVPAGTSSRPCSSSSSDEIVPSASMVTDSTPLASSTRPLSNVWVSTESASVGSLMRLACQDAPSLRNWLMRASASKSACGLALRSTAHMSWAISARRFRSRR